MRCCAAARCACAVYDLPERYSPCYPWLAVQEFKQYQQARINPFWWTHQRHDGEAQTCRSSKK